MQILPTRARCDWQTDHGVVTRTIKAGGPNYTMPEVENEDDTVDTEEEDEEEELEEEGEEGEAGNDLFGDEEDEEQADRMRSLPLGSAATATVVKGTRLARCTGGKRQAGAMGEGAENGNPQGRGAARKSAGKPESYNEGKLHKAQVSKPASSATKGGAGKLSGAAEPKPKRPRVAASCRGVKVLDTAAGTIRRYLATSTYEALSARASSPDEGTTIAELDSDEEEPAAKPAPPRPFRGFVYTDEEGDKITVSDEDGLREAIANFKPADKADASAFLKLEVRH